MSRPQIDDELDNFRRLVVASRSDPAAGRQAKESLARIRRLQSRRGAEFTPDDLHFIDVLERALGERLDAHRRGQPVLRQPPPQSRGHGFHPAADDFYGDVFYDAAWEGSDGGVWAGDERERLMDLGLNPRDPDFNDLAPHGMSGDDE